MFGLYAFMDWNGTPRIMRASTIHKRVMEDSEKSNFGWIASATDLVYVSSKEGFPIRYSIDIKAAVLNCFSVLINSDNIDTITKETDMKAVYYAYNSLFNIQDNIAIEARKQFLSSYLTRITWDTHLFLAHRGETFMNITSKWHEEKLKELSSNENINFSQMKQILTQNYINTIKKAEIEGLFEKEDAEEAEKQRKKIEKMVNDFIESYRTPDNPKRILR